MKHVDPCAFLARLIATHGRATRVNLAMFWAYFDETVVNVTETASGKQRPTDMLLGGCIGSSEQWQKFTVKWMQTLKRAGVSAFHAKHFYPYQGEFKWFKPNGDPDEKRHNKFRDRLTDIILEYADELIAFTSHVSVSARGVRQAYEDAALRALYDFTKGHTDRKDSLYIVLARHPELSPWSIINKFQQIDWEGKMAGCGIFYPDDVPPLQAADFVLHSLNRRWGGQETETFLRLQEGCRKRNKRFQQQIASTLNVPALVASLSASRQRP
jgi:hypothetical protein